MKKIGILQTGLIGAPLADKHGEYPDMFQKLLGRDEFEYKIYPVVSGIFPNDPSDCDGWIITGSKHGVYEHHDWIPPLEHLIRSLVASGKPTVGICFGHQIMAQAMGGTVEKFPKGWSAGLQEYLEFETGHTARLRAFHQDQVIIKPPSATVTHSSDFCQFAGLQYSPVCVSLQPHPEHTAEFAEDLIEARREIALPHNIADAALAVNHQPNEHWEYGNRIKSILSSE